MFTMVTKNTRMAVSTIAAVAVVSFHALALDQGYIAAAPRGTVEVGELTPVYTANNSLATLPEVVVSAKRYDTRETRYASLPSLPEITVLGRRSDSQLAQADGVAVLNAGAAAASVLLK